jgi:O-antigen/teichoic acid export membrane protein
VTTSDRPGVRATLRAVRADNDLSLVRDVAATMGNRLALVAIGMVTSVVVARALGPEGRGIFALATALTAVAVQFGNVGLHASNTWAVARDRTLLGPLLGNTLVVSLGLGGLVAGITWAVATSLPGFEVTGVILVLAIASIPVNLAYLLLQNLQLGIQKIRTYNAMELIHRLIVVAVLAIAIAGGWLNPATAVGAGLVAGVVVTSWAAVATARAAGASLRPRTRLLVEHARYGARAYVAALLAYLVLRLDLLLVGALRGATDVGYYSIAVSLAELIYLLPVVVGQMLFPRLSATTDAASRHATVRRASIGIGVAMTTGAAVAAIAAGPAINLLYGAAFAPSIPAFLWLLPGIVFLSIYTILSSYLAAVGMPAISLLTPGLGLSLNLALNLALLPGFGIVGAAIASTVTYGLMLAILVAWFRGPSSVRVPE